MEWYEWIALVAVSLLIIGGLIIVVAALRSKDQEINALTLKLNDQLKKDPRTFVSDLPVGVNFEVVAIYRTYNSATTRRDTDTLLLYLSGKSAAYLVQVPLDRIVSDNPEIIWTGYTVTVFEEDGHKKLKRV